MEKIIAPTMAESRACRDDLPVDNETQRHEIPRLRQLVLMASVAPLDLVQEQLNRRPAH